MRTKGNNIYNEQTEQIKEIQYLYIYGYNHVADEVPGEEHGHQHQAGVLLPPCQPHLRRQEGQDLVTKRITRLPHGLSSF